MNVLAGILLLIQFFLLLIFFNVQANILLLGIGWVLLLPGFILSILPITTLSTHGQVPEGDDWYETRIVVRAGLYGICRHPIILGSMILSISLTLIIQFWLSTLITAITVLLLIDVAIMEDNNNVEKLGSDYFTYRREVPRFNVFLGMYRYYKRRRIAVSNKDIVRN